MTRLRNRRLPTETFYMLLNLSNRHVHAQLVDRYAGTVITAAHTTEPAIREKLGVVGKAAPGRYATSTVAAAEQVGHLFAQRLSNSGVSAVYWSRPGRYHGKIKAFVDAVRAAGIHTHRPPAWEMPAAPEAVPPTPKLKK